MCLRGADHGDQTTRTRQEWHIVVPETQQRLQVPSHGGSLAQFVTRADDALDLFWKLAKPSTTAKKESVMPNALLPSSAPSSHLENLPAELLALILADAGLSKCDVMSLGLCSKTLWAHALVQVRRECFLSAAPWVGQMLMCTGTWLQTLPQPMYNKYPWLWKKERRYRNLNRYGDWYDPCPAQKWTSDAVASFKDVANEGWLAAFELQDEEAQLLQRAQLLSSLKTALDTQAFYTEGKWILRNQTTMQFISVQLDNMRAPRVWVQGAPWLSLDQALLLRIAWGKRVSSSLCRFSTFEVPRKIHEQLVNGPWAGHRLDAVEGDAASLGADWEDVTAETIKQAKAWMELQAEAEAKDVADQSIIFGRGNPAGENRPLLRDYLGRTLW
jgi:hypothetical protein